jgi:membrane-bound serine protease (ClpP class)
VLGWLALSLALVAGRAAAQDARPPVLVAQAHGEINPAMAGYIDRAITQAEAEGAQLLVIALDTPGGLDQSMRDITQRILAARVPVAVYVYPPGARSASAGVYITYSAHIAAMAPSTNIGSAHPVLAGGGGDQQLTPEMNAKITNDAAAWIRSLAEQRGRNGEWAEQAVRESVNLTASEAVEQHVVDLVANDVNDLLNKIDGRTVHLPGRDVRLATAGAPTQPIDMSPVERLMLAIGDPSVAYLLLSLGGLALIYELGNPGAILPGVVGGIAVILALYALGTLPINMAGVGLILFALLLFLADLLLGGNGILTVGGIFSFLIGSLLLTTSPEGQAWAQVPVQLAVGTSITMALLFGLLVGAAIRAHRRRPVNGVEAMLGQVGVARTPIANEGTVFIGGELWSASTPDGQPIPEGMRVRVLAVNGLHLSVQPA